MNPIELRDDPTCVWLHLRDEITSFHAAELLELCRRAWAADKPIRLDWSRLERLDGGALQVLLSLYRSAAEAGRELAATAPSVELAELLELAGARQLLGIGTEAA